MQLYVCVDLCLGYRSSLERSECRASFYLQVFDDWKTHVSHALEQGTEAGQLPRLSNVTLAFLEACCRADLAFEWRVFDVCAAMRQQSERKQQAQLARPRKLSHHFYEEG